jgi:hypothetical protein
MVPPWEQPPEPKAKGKKPKAGPANAEELRLGWLCEAAGLPKPVGQYQSNPDRKWAHDWAWPDHLLIVEVQGGGWIRGRHHRGDGYREDLIKKLWLQTRGWTVLEVDPQMVRDGSAVQAIKDWFAFQIQA